MPKDLRAASRAKGTYVLSHLPDMPVIGFGAQPDLILGTHLAVYPLAHYLSCGAAAKQVRPDLVCAERSMPLESIAWWLRRH